MQFLRRSTTRRRKNSPIYSSPEHLVDKPLTPQSDLYCLGLLLYEVLAGQPLYKVALGNRDRSLPRLQALRDDLSPNLDEFLQRAAAWEPEGRFPDASSMSFALKEALAGATRL